MALPPRVAGDLQHELEMAARWGWAIILVAPSVEVEGETGVPLGGVGQELNVLFTAEQAERIAMRLRAA